MALDAAAPSWRALPPLGAGGGGCHAPARWRPWDARSAPILRRSSLPGGEEGAGREAALGGRGARLAWRLGGLGAGLEARDGNRRAGDRRQGAGRMAQRASGAATSSPPSARLAPAPSRRQIGLNWGKGHWLVYRHGGHLDQRLQGSSSSYARPDACAKLRGASTTMGAGPAAAAASPSVPSAAAHRESLIVQKRGVKSERMKSTARGSMKWGCVLLHSFDLLPPAAVAAAGTACRTARCWYSHSIHARQLGSAARVV